MGAARSLLYMAPGAVLPDPKAALDIWALAVTAIEIAAEVEPPGDIRSMSSCDGSRRCAPKIDPRQKQIVRRIPPTHSPAYIALVQSAIPAWATNSGDSRAAADPLAAHAVTAVTVVGNWPPIVESPFAADGFLGKAHRCQGRHAHRPSRH